MAGFGIVAGFLTVLFARDAWAKLLDQQYHRQRVRAVEWYPRFGVLISIVRASNWQPKDLEIKTFVCGGRDPHGFVVHFNGVGFDARFKDWLHQAEGRRPRCKFDNFVASQLLFYELLSAIDDNLAVQLVQQAQTWHRAWVLDGCLIFRPNDKVRFLGSVDLFAGLGRGHW